MASNERRIAVARALCAAVGGSVWVEMSAAATSLAAATGVACVTALAPAIANRDVKSA